jgi:hypothetical protein
MESNIRFLHTRTKCKGGGGMPHTFTSNFDVPVLQEIL